jgi:hypothetical protein
MHSLTHDWTTRFVGRAGTRGGRGDVLLADRANGVFVKAKFGGDQLAWQTIRTPQDRAAPHRRGVGSRNLSEKDGDGRVPRARPIFLV